MEQTFPFSQLLTFLGQTQTFAGLPEDELALVLQIVRIQIYDKGDIIFSEGDEATGFFIVRTGRVKVFKFSPQGREQILNIFRSGDRFAEVPAFDGGCFPAYAAVLEPTELLFFPRQFFLDLLERYPQVAIHLLKSFARHLRRFTMLVDNSLKDVPGRLATYLLECSAAQADSHTIELEITKGQLAALLGTIPETLSRALQKLSRDGVITVTNQMISLDDRETLERLAI